MYYRVVTWRLVGLLDVLSCSNMAACRVIGCIIV